MTCFTFLLFRFLLNLKNRKYYAQANPHHTYNFAFLEAGVVITLIPIQNFVGFDVGSPLNNDTNNQVTICVSDN